MVLAQKNPGRVAIYHTNVATPTVRDLSGIAAALLLAGCAAMPAIEPPEPPLSYPPSVRERIQRIAIAEWREWGEQIRPVTGVTTPQFEAAETRPEHFPRLLAYWRALDSDQDAIARNRARYRAALAGEPEGAALWREPFWSAAFISYVMRSAGVDRAEFPPAAAHATYVDALIANAAAHQDGAAFRPHAPASRAPRSGDLICADRSQAAPITDWRQRAADGGRFRPMHCDIVVAVAPGRVEAIGGNVADAVTLSRFPADAAGRLLPRDSGGGPAWFVVFENRLGCLPPWSLPDPPCGDDTAPAPPQTRSPIS
jgi:hypothetical protein